MSMHPANDHYHARVAMIAWQIPPQCALTAALAELDEWRAALERGAVSRRQARAVEARLRRKITEARDAMLRGALL